MPWTPWIMFCPPLTNWKTGFDIAFSHSSLAVRSVPVSDTYVLRTWKQKELHEKVQGFMRVRNKNFMMPLIALKFLQIHDSVTPSMLNPMLSTISVALEWIVKLDMRCQKCNLKERGGKSVNSFRVNMAQSVWPSHVWDALKKILGKSKEEYIVCIQCKDLSSSS